MGHRTVTTLVLAWLLFAASARQPLVGQELTSHQHAAVDAWYRRTA